MKLGFQAPKSRPVISVVIVVLLSFAMLTNIPMVLYSNLDGLDVCRGSSFTSNGISSDESNQRFMKSEYDEYQFMDPLLRSYIETGKHPNGIRTHDDQVYFLMGASSNVDFGELSKNMKIMQVAKIGGGYMIQGYVNNPTNLDQIYHRPDVGVMLGDTQVEFESLPSDMVPTQFYVQDLLGVTPVHSVLGYDGSGVRIGLCDSGVDFGVMDLNSDVVMREFDGTITSFDPGGRGIAYTSYSQSQIAGYLLTDDLVFSIWMGDTGLFNASSDFGINTEDIYVSGITSQSGLFKVGIAGHTAVGMPAGVQVFLFLITDQVLSSVYDTIYIDWETSWALTADINSISTSIIADWDFTNNPAHMWGDGTEILATDLTGDGVSDFSMGCLANVFDFYNILAGDLVKGIDSQGRGFAFMYDPTGHGTKAATAAAGRGIVDYDLYNNGTLYKLPGAAPGAKLAALKTLTVADSMWCWLWASGFRPTPSESPYHYFHNWTYISGQTCNITSNSWGWRDFYPFQNSLNFVWGYDWTSWLIDYLSAPGYVDPSHPGSLFVMAVGNDGPGYGTGMAPSSVAALSVGASTSTHIFQETYDNNSYWEIGADQIASYSSNGPMPYGVCKPNLVAVGMGAFSVDALQYSNGDGTTGVSLWGGTSLACSLTSGIAALTIESYYDHHGNSISVDGVKYTLESTAIDLGYGAFKQGSGRINAWRAVHAAMEAGSDGTNPVVIAFCNSAWENVAAQGDRAGGWLGYYMGMFMSEYTDGSGFNDEKKNNWQSRTVHPSETYYHFDNSIFTGSMFPGETEVLQIYAYRVDGYAVDSAMATELVLWDEAITTLTTTSSITTWALEDHFSLAFMNLWNSSDYATIFLTYPKTQFEQLYQAVERSNNVFLYDWTDLNSNNRIDFAPDSNGEVRCISSDRSGGNNHQLCIGNPGASFYRTGPSSKGPTIYYRDIGIEEGLWTSLDVVVTIRLYHKVSWSGIPIDVDVTQDAWSTWNVTVTVDATAVPGMYEGIIEWTESGFVAARTPIVVRVDGYCPAESTLSWGGTNSRPYDNGATFGSINWDAGTPKAGDWRFYFVDIDYYLNVGPTDFTTWVMTNVSWSDPDTVIDVYLFMSGYGNNAYFGPYSAVQSQSVNYGGSGRTEGTPTGPTQNVLVADFTSNVSSLINGSLGQYGYLGIAIHTIEYGSNNAYEDFTITVHATRNSTLTSYREASPGHNALDGLMSNKPTGTIQATSHGSLTVISDSSWEGPHVTLSGAFPPWALLGFPTIQIRETEIRIESEGLQLSSRTVGLSAQIDTHDLGINGVFTIVVQGYTRTSLDWIPIAEHKISNVNITNFFKPFINITYPNTDVIIGPYPTILTWEANDPNTEDTLLFDVYLSDDNGANWWLLASNITETQTEFDPLQTPLSASNQWLLLVNCTDGMFLVSDTSDSTFTVVQLISPPTLIPLEIILIVIAVIIIISVVSVIIIWLRKRKQP